MKNLFRTGTAILVTIFLVGCSGATEASRKPVQNDDHHEGETNVMPHDDSQTGIDHHEGEMDVAPHGHSVSSHDDSNQPPHRH